MKNIHVLPTDKPSRLFTDRYGKLKDHYTLSKMPLDSIGSNQNIYITNDEEIKYGDWYIANDLNIVVQHLQVPPIKNDKKITLTTDSDLIGVQAIDDEFLEWFVKNPSCEIVQVEKETYRTCVSKDDCICYSEVQQDFCSCFIKEYKIIIPKEEVKKYPIGGYAPGNYMCSCSTCKKEFIGDKRAVQCEPCAISMTKEEPKQETLEEARAQAWIDFAKTNKDVDMYSFVIGYDKGFKWQQEQMYSDKEVLEILCKREDNINNTKDIFDYQDYRQWFKQYKR